MRVAPHASLQDNPHDGAPNAGSGSGCLTVFGLLFAIPGLLAGVSTLRKFADGRAGVEQLVLGCTAALVLVGAGVGLIVSGRLSAKAAAKDREIKARNPDKPWLWREDWTAGFARSEWKSAANLMAVMGAVFLLLSIPMFVSIGAGKLKGHPFQTALVLVFPMAGVYMVSQSVLGYLRFRKFREMRLRLASVPCPLGGKLQGRLEIEQALPPQAMVRLKLSCVHSYVSGSGRDNTRWEKVLWQDRKDVPASTDGQASFLPVEFVLPYNVRETDSHNPDDEILWRLTASSSLPGLDFIATFRAPVFKTAASDASLTTTALDARSEGRPPGAQPAESTIVTGTAPDGGLLFYLGPARNKRTAAALTAFGLIFLGSGLFFGIASSRAFTWFIGIIPLTVGAK